jgi:hypothetical protein
MIMKGYKSFRLYLNGFIMREINYLLFGGMGWLIEIEK